jgi:hypothetical protein
MNPAKALAGSFTLAAVCLTLVQAKDAYACSTSSYWCRTDTSCPPPSTKEKTNCSDSGNEQCTAQYCN